MEDNIIMDVRGIARIAQRYSTGLRAGLSGIRVPAEAENFSLHRRVQTGSGAHPSKSPIQCVPGALSLGVKPSGREADHSSPSSAEVKNAWSYAFTPANRLMTWHRQNFTYTLKKWGGWGRCGLD
jgi:hypothetical protein